MDRYSSRLEQPDSSSKYDCRLHPSSLPVTTGERSIPSIRSPTAVSELPSLVNSSDLFSADSSGNTSYRNGSDCGANTSICSHRAAVSVPAGHFYGHDSFESNDGLGRITLSEPFDEGSGDEYIDDVDSRNPSPSSPNVNGPEFVVDVQENGGAEVTLRATESGRSPLVTADDENVRSQPENDESLRTPIPVKKSRKIRIKPSELFSQTLCSMPSALQEGVDGVKEIIKRRDSPERRYSEPSLINEPLCHHPQQHLSKPPKNSENSEAEFIPSLPETPDKLPYGHSLTCGNDCYMFDKESEVAIHRQKTVEGTITNFLASPGDWCDGWQAWSVHMDGNYDCFDGFLNGGRCDRTSSSFAAEPVEIRRILRNRAGNLNSRAQRIQRLREDLSPFGRAGENKRNKAAVDIKSTRSFTIESSVGSGNNRKGRTTASSDVPESVVSCTSSLLDSIHDCGKSAKDSPSHPQGEDYDEDLCYDSDPGETTLRRGVLHAGTNNDVESFLRHGRWRDAEIQSPKAPNDENEAGSRKMFRRARHSVKKSLDLSDEVAMKRIIEETIHQKMTLVWHRASNDQQEKSDSPMAVRAWIELGSQLNNTLIQPKFIWRPVQNSADNKSSTKRGGGVLGITNLDLRSIDLLDISRVYDADYIDRQSHFLAKKHCSFVIETFDRSFLFETSCETERDKIVSGLKIIIARLGSKIIVGDDSVFDEFFTPFGLSVPGEAPSWAKNGSAENRQRVEL